VHNDELDAATDYLLMTHVPNFADELLTVVHQFKQRRQQGSSDSAYVRLCVLMCSREHSTFGDSFVTADGDTLSRNLPVSECLCVFAPPTRVPRVTLFVCSQGALCAFKLTQLMHSKGVNVRHAGRVLQVLREQLDPRERQVASVFVLSCV
jgi:hypothetical protein